MYPVKLQVGFFLVFLGQSLDTFKSKDWPRKLEDVGVKSDDFTERILSIIKSKWTCLQFVAQTEHDFYPCLDFVLAAIKEEI